MKKYKLFKSTILFCFVATFVSAQIPNWTWLIGNGGTASDEGKAITADKFGNTITVGDFQSSPLLMDLVVLGNATPSTTDIFIVKRNPQGAVLWAREAGSTANERAKSVTTDQTGNIYVTGYFQSSSITFSSTTLTNSGASDIYIVKYSPTGSLIWAKKMGGIGDDFGNGIVADAAGNIYITGYYSNTISFGSTTLTSSGVRDIFIAKYNTLGNAVWAKSAGGSSSDESNSIALDKNNNAYITGTFTSSVATFSTTNVNNSAAGNDIFIAKYSSVGTLVWAKGTGGSGTDVVYSIATDTSSNAYITGYTASTSFVFAGNAITSPDLNFILLKYNTAGVEQWGKSVGAAGHQAGAGIATDEKNNVYVVGDYAGANLVFGSTTILNAGAGVSRDAMLLKFDDLGNPIGAKSMGGTAQDYAHAICIDTANSIYVTGSTSSSVTTFDSFTYTSAGSYDILTAKIYSLVTPDICMITVDELSNNNIIYWDKSNLIGVDSFLIYRETANNIYKKIGVVSNDSIALFIDTVRHLYLINGDPNIATYKYKICVKNVLGDTSALSLWHKTVFTSQNGGLFAFNDYGIEGQTTPVPQLNQYLLKRDDSGASGVWGIVGGSTSSPINDPNYSNYPNGKWRVETDWTISCDSSRGTISTSRSNIKQVVIFTGIIKEINNQISIYPNPSKNNFTVFIPEIYQCGLIKIFNSLGQEIYLKKFSENKTKNIDINTNGIAPGIYSIGITTEEGNAIKKIIIQ